MFCGAIVVLFMGVIGKLGVLFASIPGPIIGGMYLMMFGVVAAVGISNLRVNIHYSVICHFLRIPFPYKPASDTCTDALVLVFHFLFLHPFKFILPS